MSAPLARTFQAAQNPQRLASKAIRNPRLIPDIMEGMTADKARIKYGCAKALRIISEQRPDLLYPQFDFFVHMLDHENKIFQWDAAFVLSHLARADDEDKIAAVFGKYFSPIPGPVMITAANVIQGGARLLRPSPIWLTASPPRWSRLVRLAIEHPSAATWLSATLSSP